MDHDLTSIPVDVVKPQRGHFTSSKTETNEEEENGMVSSADVRPAVTTLKQLFDLVGLQTSR